MLKPGVGQSVSRSELAGGVNMSGYDRFGARTLMPACEGQGEGWAGSTVPVASDFLIKDYV